MKILTKKPSLYLHFTPTWDTVGTFINLFGSLQVFEMDNFLSIRTSWYVIVSFFDWKDCQKFVCTLWCILFHKLSIYKSCLLVDWKFVTIFLRFVFIPFFPANIISWMCVLLISTEINSICHQSKVEYLTAKMLRR